MLFLHFIVPIFAWNVPLVSLIFLKRSLVFPILLFSSICLHWLLRKAFLSLLVILWFCIQMGISFLFFFAIHFSSFLCYCKLSSFSWQWSWSVPPIQFYKCLSIVLQALCLSDITPWIYLSLPLLKHKRVWFRWYLNGLVIFPTFLILSLNFAISSSWSVRSQLPVLFSLIVYSFSFFNCKEQNQSDFSIDHLVMSIYRVVSCVVGEGVCYNHWVPLAKLFVCLYLHTIHEKSRRWGGSKMAEE